ncbi:MAG: hypothetical protein Q8O55_08755 [Dehalococcoidales bacterium]|nr:hypothetical protein [Dehalococcoidales bacterium]
MEKTRINQIIPATGWLAVYLIDEPPFYCTSPLVCWGLGETETEDGEVFPNIVVGFSNAYDMIELCEEVSNFEAYIRETNLREEEQKAFSDRGRTAMEKKRSEKKI